MGGKIINWMRGASSVLEIWPDTGSRIKEQFLTRSDAEALRSDAEALYGDWLQVGNDIRSATEEYEREQGEGAT